MVEVENKVLFQTDDVVYFIDNSKYSVSNLIDRVQVADKFSD